MFKFACHCGSAVVCIFGAGIVLRVAQWRIYRFDIVSQAAWREFWRSFVANEIVFDTLFQAGFVLAFPLALALALFAMGPVAATLLDVALRFRRSVVRARHVPSIELPDLSVGEVFEAPATADQEIADLLYERLFDAAPEWRGGDRSQDHERA